MDGAAGLGKTALMRHARTLADAAGFRVLSARGAELEQAFTFGVVRQLFEPVLPRAGAERSALFTGVARATEPLFSGTGQHGVGTGDAAPESLYAMLNGLYWLLVDLAERTPLVVLVDDAQWADPPSLRFLGFLARRIQAVPVTVIVATRSGEHDESGLVDDILTADDVTLLRLRSLSAAAVADWVRREFGPDAADEFCSACYTTTSGNPLFVRELLRVLLDAHTSPDADAAASVHAAGPDAVRQHVAARLRRLPADVRRVARAMAVLGDDTALTLVARQADLPLPVTTAASERLVRQGILERADPPAFLHAIVRDVVLSLVPLTERDAEHERAVGVLMATGAPVATVASHLLRTGPTANPEWVTVLLTAADEARKQGSLGGAAVYLARARAEPPVRPLRSEISRLLGNCQAHQLAVTEAEVLLREALELADTPYQRAVCAYSLARLRNALGEPGEAVDLLVTAVEYLPAGQHPAMESEMVSELIGIARSDPFRRPLLLAHLAAFHQRPDRPDAVLNAQLSTEAVFEGRTAEGVDLARAALAGDHLTPERTGIWAAVHTLVVADRLDEAEQRLQRALDTAVRTGLLLAIGMIRAYLARVALLRGDLVQAGEHVRAGNEAAPTPNIAWPLLQSTAIHLFIEQDRIDDAEMVLRSGVLADGQPARSALNLWLHGARVRLRTVQDRHETALADALSAGRTYERWGGTRMLDVPWRLYAARAHSRLGDRAAAGAMVAEHLRLARESGVARQIAIGLRAAATVGDTDPAEPLTEAVTLLRDGPGRLELARTLADLGDALLRAGDRPTARETLRHAAELALECQATGLVERLRGRLAAGGGRPPRLTVTGVHALTPAERQVAQLAGTGLTNRRIAERLFVTEKTVEAHLSHAYRKLGVTSRTQLAARLAAATPSTHPETMLLGREAT
jgi:DNA-binding CsgD family transcriptional regulator